ncbi:MAG: HAD-IIIA family hydrolase [Ignavibacterium sp.]|jgi:YrbI family 3-deoxy-D-manno-octulosonate 8-phosphate phosphatase|uniref:KdsC family phosphatase n=1 Tax=Ignavibacterium sp. TaxID=2651167 RepID=UPI0032996289
MVIDKKLAEKNFHLKSKAEKIKLIITDVDGVLTDTGIYYSPTGEALKRYSIRDGMGVERLRKYADIETIIITGENSGTVKSRAEKLKITQVYLGVKDKEALLEEIKKKNQLSSENIAYIGDDSNDYDIMKLVGFTATPADGMSFIKEISDYVCEAKGGYGAFREFAELIISLKQ